MSARNFDKRQDAAVRAYARGLFNNVMKDFRTCSHCGYKQHEHLVAGNATFRCQIKRSPAERLYNYHFSRREYVAGFYRFKPSLRKPFVPVWDLSR